MPENRLRELNVCVIRSRGVLRGQVRARHRALRANAEAQRDADACVGKSRRAAPGMSLGKCYEAHRGGRTNVHVDVDGEGD